MNNQPITVSEEDKKVQRSTKVMLINVSLKKPGITKTDRKVGEATGTALEANPEHFSDSKKLLLSPTYKAITKLDGFIRNQIVKRYTMDWTDRERKLVPVDLIDKLESMLDEQFDERQKLVNQLANEYEELIDDASQKHHGLGQAFNRDDYLPKSEFIDRFKASRLVEPLPASDHITATLSQEQLDRFGESLERSVNEQFHACTREVAQRTAKELNDLIEGLERHGKIPEGGKKKGKFNNNTVKVVNKLIDILPSLNVTGDPVLDQTAHDLREKIGGLNPEELRENEVKRHKVAEEAKQIVDNLTGMY